MYRKEAYRMKKKGLQFFDFIIFSNLFIALCAVGMCCFTAAFLQAGTLPLHFIGFVFFSTLASYSIHWYLTNAITEKTETRTIWLLHNKWVHSIFFIISAVGSIWFLLQEREYWKWMLPAIALTIMYSAPKFPHPWFRQLEKYILGKTFLLAAMWTYVTAILPVLILNGTLNQPFLLFIINRFSLLFAICVLFDQRDKQHDRAIGIKSLVTLLPLSQIKLIFSTFILLSMLSAAMLYPYSQSLITTIWLIAPALLTYLLFPSAIKSRNDYLFYFILDGLMALSPLLYFTQLIF